MWDRLEAIENRYEELGRLMALPETVASPETLQTLAREQASIEELVTLYRRYKTIRHQHEDTEALLRDGLDEQMEALAKEELALLRAKAEELVHAIQTSLLPKDPKDDKDVFVEIRAGAGGQEAALFAAGLFRMYARYAETKGWHTEVVSASESGIGGFKEIIFEVRGKGAFSHLKYESGVHRVQRVPVTEASGRIHTSTATVAVLPEAEEVDIDVSPDDLRIDIFTAVVPEART